MLILDALDSVFEAVLIVLVPYVWRNLYEMIADRSIWLAAAAATGIMSVALFSGALIGDAINTTYNSWSHPLIYGIGRTCNHGMLVCHSLSAWHTLFPGLAGS
jgi:hypothetical protein